MNVKTKKSTWVKPEAWCSADDWIERKDPKTGRKYFVNKITHKTTWHKPGSKSDAKAKQNESAIAAAKAAVEFDKAKEYKKAIEQYQIVIKHFSKSNDKNSKASVKQYKERVKYLKEHLVEETKREDAKKLSAVAKEAVSLDRDKDFAGAIEKYVRYIQDTASA